MNTTAGKWDDLWPRLISAVVMIALAIWGIYAGGVIFTLLLLGVAVAGFWEIWRMQRGRLGNLGDLIILVVYGAAILLACWGFVALRSMYNGRSLVIFVVAIVVISDVAGYFAGRIIGGPKFWPKVSPKKTWSGTVAGWIGAAVVGVSIFYNIDEKQVIDLSTTRLIACVSALLALAAQMGDIAESAIKRRANIKDSSNLIPGHGGVLDRFDGMIGAGLVVALFLIKRAV